MKKYLVENYTQTWWAEYWTNGMAATDNQKIMSIRSKISGSALNPTDLDATMAALGLPSKVGEDITEVTLKALCVAQNLKLTMRHEADTAVVKYAGLALQATPTFSPVAGAVPAGQVVTIISSGADAIYYTLDGTIPTTASTNQADTTCSLTTGNEFIRALAVKSGKYKSNLSSAQYSKAFAAGPTTVTLAVGSSAPVGAVVAVAIPANGATDDTGKVTGWVTTSADKIKITVVNAASTSSTMTIDGEAYVSGADYQIAAVGTLTVVLTTTRSNYTTTVRTFTIDVAAAE